MRVNIDALQSAYNDNKLTPARIMADIRQRSQQYAEHNIWIYQLSAAEQQPYLDALADKPMADCPLWGIPFVIRNNIDLAGTPTTAGCEGFSYPASFLAGGSVVDQCRRHPCRKGQPGPVCHRP